MTDPSYDYGQSPDDVTVTIARESGKQIAIVVGVVQDRSNICVRACRALVRGLTFSCQQALRRKGTLVLLLIPVASITATVLFMSYLEKDGFPPTSQTKSASIRLLVSVLGMIFVSFLGFYIINLRLTNLVLGIAWMLLIVTILYTLSTSLTFAFRFQLAHSDENSKNYEYIFDGDIKEYVSYQKQQNPGVRFPYRFETFMLKHECCDFNFHSPQTLPKKKSEEDELEEEELGPYETLWDYVYMGQNVTPAACCGVKNKDFDSNECTKDSEDRFTNMCDKKQFLKEIWEIMWFAELADSIFLVIVCIEGFVFWYYYSDIKEKQFANEEQPGDFELLCTTQINEEDTEVPDAKTMSDYRMIADYYANSNWNLNYDPAYNQVAPEEFQQKAPYKEDVNRRN